VTVVYHLCSYDRTTGKLVAEYPVPARLVPTIRTFIDPVPDDRDLVLSYALTDSAALRLAEALGLTIDPDRYHYYFEGSDGADTDVSSEVAVTSR
jgi:hypothetical protein